LNPITHQDLPGAFNAGQKKSTPDKSEVLHYVTVVKIIVASDLSLPISGWK